MSLLEQEMNRNNIERANNAPEFQKRSEFEKKFIITQPEKFEAMKEYANDIDQIYLSHPSEEFSLRVRHEQTPTGSEYTATLKDSGSIVDGMRKRLEVETPISAEAYAQYYNQSRFPRVYKKRATIEAGVTIDFIDGIVEPILEIETTDSTVPAELLLMLEGIAEEKTDNRAFDTESIAHQLSSGEMLAPKENLTTFSQRIAHEMIAHYATGREQVVVGLSGMSGSGKTTVTKVVQQYITEAFGETFKPIVVSTDDYHKGKKWLEDTYGAPWTEWDDPRVYNTQELAHDLANLAEGVPLIRRHFDFDKEETIYDEEVAPSPFVIIEGLYAGSKDLAESRSLHFELPTGIATSVGRDVRRLIIEDRANRAFPTPESRLRYQIESALPMYLSQERPTHNSFSSSTRLLAERAFMLDKLATLQ